ncbi:MAG: NADH-quinone oxidoreductase subunit D, partial [Tepidisphaeraceae bacterium]
MAYTLNPVLEPLPGEQGGGTADQWTLNFGPQHPATHTTLRLVLEL